MSSPMQRGKPTKGQDMGGILPRAMTPMPAEVRKNPDALSPSDFEIPPGFPALVQFYGTETRISGDIARLIGNFNPRYVNTDIRWLMRNDPDVAFGLSILSAPIVNLDYSIESHDPVIKAFVEWALEHCYRQAAIGLCNAIPFGRQICEKVWTSSDLELEVSDTTTGSASTTKMPLVWFIDRCKAIDPRTYNFLIDHEIDDWVGVEQLFMRYGLPPLEPVSREHLAFWCFRREQVFGRLEGYPMLDHTYEPWWFKTALSLIGNRYFERKAEPATKARAGQSIRVGGQEKDGFAYMQSQLAGLKSGSTVMLPSARDPKDPKSFLFDIEYFQDDKRGDQIQHRIDSLSTQILRSLWITDRAGTSSHGGQGASGGGYGQSKQHAELMAQGQEAIVDEFAKEVIQKDFVDPLVLYNFGQEAFKTSRTKIVTSGVSQSMQQVYQDLINAIITAESKAMTDEPIKIWELIDRPAILAQLQVPLRPADELEELTRERQANAQAAQQNGSNGAPRPAPGDPKLGDPELEKAVRDKILKAGATDHGVGTPGANAGAGSTGLQMARRAGAIAAKKAVVEDLGEIRTELASVKEEFKEVSQEISEAMARRAEPTVQHTHVHLDKGAIPVNVEVPITHNAGDVHHHAGPTTVSAEIHAHPGKKTIVVKDAEGKESTATIEPTDGGPK